MRLLNNIIIQSENFLTNFELQIDGTQKLVLVEERNRDKLRPSHRFNRQKVNIILRFFKYNILMN
jgi:hypothetical protein